MRTRHAAAALLLALALTGAPAEGQEVKVEGKATLVPTTQPAAPAAAPVTPAKAEVPKAAPAAAPAEPAKAEGEQKWWQSLLADLIAAALAIFVPVLSALGFLLLRKLGVKVDLETLDSLAGKAALYAEKKAATALGEGKPKSSGAQKEEWAWELIKSVDEKLAGSAKAKEKLRALILAKIPEAEATVSAAKPAAPANPGG